MCGALEGYSSSILSGALEGYSSSILRSTCYDLELCGNFSGCMITADPGGLSANTKAESNNYL